MGRNGSHKKRGLKYRGGLHKFQEWMAGQDRSSSSEDSNVPVVGGQAQARRRLVRAANSLAQLVKKDKKAKKHKKDKKAKKHRRSSSSSSSSSSRSSSKGRAPKVEGKNDDRKEADTTEEAKPPGLENEEAKPPLPTKDDHQAWQPWQKKEESKPWPVQGNAWPKKEEKEAWPKKEEKPQAQAWPKKEEKPQAVAWVWKAKATQCDVCEFRSYWGRGDCTTASCPIKKENSAEQNKRHRMKAWLEKEQRKKEEAELQELALRADEELRQAAQEVKAGEEASAAKEARASEDAQKAHLTVQPPTIQRNVR